MSFSEETKQQRTHRVKPQGLASQVYGVLCVYRHELAGSLTHKYMTISQPYVRNTRQPIRSTKLQRKEVSYAQEFPGHPLAHERKELIHFELMFSSYHHRWEPFQRIQPINVKFLTTNFPLAISDEILESLGAAIKLVFRHVDGIDISMDIYLPKETSAKPIPVILWWHGGGLIQGTRKGISPHLALAPDRHQLCVVSADYRLAPQSRFPEVLSDCKAAVDFLHSPAFQAATNNRVDASKLVVSGSSAGGWLSLLVGNGIGYEACGLESPASRVRGIAAIYPITDLNDPFWTDKKEKAAYFERAIPQEEMAEYLNPKAPKVASSSLDSPRWLFYTYMVQEGILADLLLGGTSIPPEEFSVGRQIKIGRFTPPPTYLVHGTIDTKVPFSQATAVVDAYKDKGVDVDFHVMEVEHGFDLAGMYRLDRMYDFVKRVMG